MKFKDYYKTLGVARSATGDEIKHAYRKLAHQFHPDISKDPTAEDKFKAIGEAYATLKDKEKRAAYDELGRHPTGQEFKPPPDWASQHGKQAFSFDDIDLSDLFKNFSTGKRQARPGPHTSTPGQDYELATEISLEDAYHGATVDLNFSVPEYDQHGQQQHVAHTLKTRLPKGVSDGQKMLLRGKGGKAPQGGAAGNLYLHISFKPHRLFRVKGYDIYLDLPITPWEAALGAQVEVPTLAGAVKLKIAAGAHSGQKLRINKRGLPNHNHEFGDLFAVVQIVLPNKLSARELELFKALADSSSFNPRAHF